ncbi:eCIS core domain-containing protein [Novosphingobium sp.]|uniref:eCIS core domain-containing protein n=1 Tax=Novosphingobium sp. TaxID=1874826 RepID=UPI003BA8D312
MTAPARSPRRTGGHGAPPRPAFALRHRTAHERQADQRGAGYARGEGGLSRGLSAAPAAGFTAPGSVGAPLDPALLGSLEAAFAADLRAVRIHRDAAAGSAVSALGASAFASGTAIYFAPGRFDPGAPAGRALIGHEITHVLQQTGRRNARGQLAAQPLFGSGPVQCAPGPANAADEALNDDVRSKAAKLAGGIDIGTRFAKLELLSAATGTASGIAVLDRHLATEPEAAMKEEIAAIRAAINGQDSDAALAALRERAKLADRAAFGALYHDCFKALGANADAAAMAGDKPPAITAFGSWSFYEATRPANASWVIAELTRHPVAKKYYPAAVVAVARNDFYGLGRVGQNLDPAGKFDETIGAAIAEALLYNPLMPHERTAVALRALAAFDTVRLQTFGAIETLLKGSKDPLERFKLKRRVMEIYADTQGLANLARNAKVEPEVIAIAADAGARIAPIAARSAEAWRRIEAATAASDTPQPGAAKEQVIMADALRKAIRARVGSIKGLAKVEPGLMAALGIAARLENGGLPSGTALARNRKAAAAAVAQVTFAIDGAFAAREKSLDLRELPAIDPQSADPARDVAAAVTDDMVYGILLLSLYRLESRLLQAAKTPETAADETARIRQQDEAALGYRRTLELFFDTASLFGYDRLTKAIFADYLAEQAGVTRSYVALLEPFKPVPATLAEFAKDFPPGEIKGFPVSGAALIELVYSAYYGTLLTQLQAALKDQAGVNTVLPDGSIRHTPVVNIALGATENLFKVPARYRVPKESTILFVRPGEDRKRVPELLVRKQGKAPERDHPVVEALTSTLKPDELYVAPLLYEAHLDGYTGWVIGGLGDLAETLANLPGVPDLVTDKGTVLGWPDSFEGGPRLWLIALARLTSDRAPANAAVLSQMRSDLASLAGPLRRATNVERRYVGPLIAAQWERVQKSLLKDPNAFFDAPRRALELTQIFAGNVQPSTSAEQKLQMTALMLELAPVLTRKLGSSTVIGESIRIAGTDRFDIILPLHRHIDGAAAFAGNPANAQLLEKLELTFPAEDLDRRVRILRTLAGEFAATVKEHQADSVVVQGLKSENMLRIAGRGFVLRGSDGSPDGAGESFDAGNAVYQLITVHETFTYEPEMLGVPSVVEWEREAIGTRNLIINGKANKPGDPRVHLVTIMRTDNRTGKTEQKEIWSDDTQLLSELGYALDLHITLRNLEILGEVRTEGASMLTLAIQIAFAEVPGVSEALAAAEITGSILQFWGSGEYAMIKSVLNGDVGPLFEKLAGQISQDLSREVLWGWLVLGDPTPPTFAAIEGAMALAGRMGVLKGKANSGDEAKDSSIKRVVAGLLGGGSKLVHGAETMHQYTSFAMHKVELGIQGSPWAALIMRVIARNLYRLEGVSLKEFGIDKAADALEEFKAVYQRFDGIIEGLANFELPSELVPLEAIIEMVLNFVIDHLPLKYRKPIQLVRSVVNATPMRKVYDELFKTVADEMRKASIDPNILWRDYVKASLDPYLKLAGQEITDEWHALLIRVPFLKSIPKLTVPDLATSFVTGDVAPKLADGTAMPPAPPQLPAGRGAALGAGDRAAAQRGYGHDFAHVRVHQGGAVDSSLRASGARAATSGSHVYLDSAVTTGGGGGRDVLHHELAHVLQQTGPRPLGTRHSAQPVSGSAGSGPARWRIDRGAERQADRLAQASRDPAPAPRPVSHGAGIAPSLTDIAEKFFLKLGDSTSLEENAATLKKTPPRAADVNKAAPGLRATLSEKLTEALGPKGSAGSRITFKDPFDAAADAIREYILTNRKQDVADGIPHLLGGALQDVKIKSDAGTAKAKTETAPILNVGRLETLLEEFFFGVTGVSVDIEFNTTRQPGPDGRKRDTITLDDPFKTFAVTYLHLPMIGGTAKLWDDVIDATFPKAGAKRAIYQAKTRLALQGLQPGPGIFTTTSGKKGKALTLGSKAKSLAEAYVNPPPTRDLPGDAVPTWAEYTDTKPGKRTVHGGKDYGQIGLRLGTYGQKDNPDQQKGTDRASHHTVQYLLIEYLVNTKDRHQPFPHSLGLYPNIKAASDGRVATIGNAPGATDGIRVAANDSGDRGPNMPTILLSVHAHTLGNVHVSVEPDDLPNAGPSQGAAIHGKFRTFLGDHAAAVADKKGLQALAAQRAGKTFAKGDLPKVKGKPVTDAELSTAIFTAACKSYTWMQDHMNTKLKTALDKHEIDYYNSLVNASGKKTGSTVPPAYKPESVSSDVLKEVKKAQVATFESAAFGFERR